MLGGRPPHRHGLALPSAAELTSSAVNALTALDRSVAYYAPGFESQAAVVAGSVDGADVQPMPALDSIVDNGSSTAGDIDLVVMLGNDHALSYPNPWPTTTG